MARGRILLKRLSFIILSVAFGFFICILFYFKFGGYFLIGKEERVNFVNKVKSSPQLPDRFYEAYNVVYPNSLQGGQLDYFIGRDIKKRNNVECPCRLAAYDSGFTEYVYKNLPLTVFYLENYVSQKECLNYYANQIRFREGIIGVKQASRIFFERDIEELDVDECVRLVQMFRGSYSYQ